MTPEERKEYARKYYLANRDKIIEKANRWKQDNFERWSEWREANKSHIYAVNKKWIAENPEKRLAQKRRSYKKNRTSIRAKAKLRYDTDPAYRRKVSETSKERKARIPREVFNARLRDYRKKNRDKVLQTKAEYRNKNRDKIYSGIHARRVKLRGSGGKYTAAEWGAMKVSFDHRCACCRENLKLTVDHVIPVAHGGTNTIDNIQPLCLTCNIRKGVKHTDYRQAFHSSPL